MPEDGKGRNRQRRRGGVPSSRSAVQYGMLKKPFQFSIADILLVMAIVLVWLVVGRLVVTNALWAAWCSAADRRCNHDDAL